MLKYVDFIRDEKINIQRYVSGLPTFYDDRIKFYAIEAGGFDIVAKSYEDAKTKPKPPKFYLDKESII